MLFVWWLIVVCCDCVCVGNVFWGDFVWWVNVSVGFRVGGWSFEYYLLVGVGKVYDGDCDVWNEFCLGCCGLGDFYGLGVDSWVGGCKSVICWFWVVLYLLVFWEVFVVIIRKN